MKGTKQMKKDLLKDILGTSIFLLIVLVLTFLLITFVGQRTVVHGDSMMETLYDGDNLVVDKITYRFHEPNRFDIVVFPYQYESNTYYIKRIIGLPGDTVRIDDAGIIYINEEPLEEHYGTGTIRVPGLAETSVFLAADEYFVLGDNRNNSADSRDPNVGNVKRSQLIGKAWIRIYPFNRLGKIKTDNE